MTYEVWALLGMCVCGIICALLYDIFRSVHYVLKKHDIIVIISDVIYWILAAVIIINSLWYLNTGLIRAYEFAGLFIGAVLYFCAVSRYVYKFFLTITLKCVKIFKGIYKILLTLTGFLYKITIAPVYGISVSIKQKVIGRMKKEREGSGV